MGTEAAQARWELENSIESVDRIFVYDEKHHKEQVEQQPWTKDPQFFKRVRISALALLKMVLHARSGQNLEVMGVMQGKIEGDTMIVLDAFALPVEGTETRVNAQADAFEYLVQYQTRAKDTGRLENVIGWYHSHPGYGCWLSGIDVETQTLNQSYQEPFLAVVIDPKRTIAAGKVELGAFRTYPRGYTPPDAKPSEYQSVPLEKIQDFGVHAAQYYALEVSYFKSSVDAGLLERLWEQYWASTLAQSPLVANRDYMTQQIVDIAKKTKDANTEVLSTRVASYLAGAKRPEDNPLHKIILDCAKAVAEEAKGVSSQLIKSALFQQRLPSQDTDMS